LPEYREKKAKQISRKNVCIITLISVIRNVLIIETVLPVYERMWSRDLVLSISVTPGQTIWTLQIVGSVSFWNFFRSWQQTNKNAIPSIFCDNNYCMTKSNSFLL